MAIVLKELEDYRMFMGKEELHKAINSLMGILGGMSVDGVISSSEVSELKTWYEHHRPLINLHPFTELLPVIDSALSDDVLEESELSDIVWLCNNIAGSEAFTPYFNETTSAIQWLEGFLHGVMADGHLSDEEIALLSQWLDGNDFLRGIYPYDEIYSLLLAAREDGVISDDERNMLVAFFATFINTSASCNIRADDMEALQQKYSIGGICAVCPDITIPGNVFCFTGISKRAKRIEIAAIVSTHGGIYHDKVTSKTNYLIVGAGGNPCWAFSCYGRKVEEAVNLRKAGSGIQIIHEYDFWDEISD